MSLYETKLAELQAKHARQLAGLQAAQGLIAEAEALCESITAYCQPGEAPSPLVTVYDKGDVDILIYIWSHHPAVRCALANAGLEIVNEVTVEPNPFQPRKSRSVATLAGFSVRLEFEGEVEWLALAKEAA